MTTELLINGSRTRVDVPDDTALSDVLRDSLGLFGTKIGCAVGQCGACTVLIDEEPYKSCLIPVGKAEGREITTIEGLQGRATYERLAEAFVAAGAIQCGFCTPGFVVAATALLESQPDVNKDRIESELSGHLCRCTGYRKIIDAVEATARGAEPISAGSAEDGYIGQRVAKIDAWAKVRGEARYGADIAMPGMLHAAFVRSPYPYAKILSIDDARALSESGVVTVVTASDVPGELMIGEILKDTPVLAHDVVRFIGDPVAVVAADTPEAASRGARLVDVRYEVLPPVLGPEAALADGATPIHPEGNLMGVARLRKGDPRTEPDELVTVQGLYTTPRIEHAYLEPEAGIAYIEDGALTLLTSCQYPHYVHEDLMRVTGLARDRTRVIQTTIGGAFGGKVDVSVQMAIALVTLKTGRPAKMTFDRTESIETTVKRHPFAIDHRLSASKDGTMVEAAIDIINDTGAYALAGPIVLKRVATHAAGAYAISNVKTDVKSAYTNTVPCGAMRGFGLPQAFFATECQVDRLAAALQIDPIEFRLRNILRDGSLTHTSQEVSNVGLEECLTTIRSIRDQRRQELSTMNLGPEKRRGLGVAVMHYGLGYSGVPNPAIATTALSGDARLQVVIGLVDVGQGSSTIFAQLAAQTMGVDMSRIDVITEDTWMTIDPGPTSASRDTYFGGNAVRAGVEEVRATFLDRLADAFGHPRASLDIHGDSLWHDGSRLMGFEQACAEHLGTDSITGKGVFDPEITLDDNSQGDPYPAYSYAAQLAETEVDLRTGKVDLIKLWAVHDSGRIINPDGAEGQVEGGALMALGNTLMEQLVIEDGMIVNPDLAGYMIPTTMDTFELDTIFINNDEPSGPFGAKGIGECSLLPTAPAIANAVYDAVGYRVFDLPIDPERVLAWIETSGSPDDGSLTLPFSER